MTAQHPNAQTLPGRDLAPALRGDADFAELAAPVYFMTEDEISRGDIHNSPLTGEAFEAIAGPSCVESVITAVDGKLWKLNRYYDGDARTDEQDWELHDLSTDPGERENRYQQPNTPSAVLEDLLAEERRLKRLTPAAEH